MTRTLDIIAYTALLNSSQMDILCEEDQLAVAQHLENLLTSEQLEQELSIDTLWKLGEA